MPERIYNSHYGNGVLAMFSVVQLKGKYCRKPHCCNGVVDTFRLWFTNHMQLASSSCLLTIAAKHFHFKAKFFQVFHKPISFHDFLGPRFSGSFFLTLRYRLVILYKKLCLVWKCNKWCIGYLESITSVTMNLVTVFWTTLQIYIVNFGTKWKT